MTQVRHHLKQYYHHLDKNAIATRTSGMTSYTSPADIPLVWGDRTGLFATPENNEINEQFTKLD